MPRRRIIAPSPEDLNPLYGASPFSTGDTEEEVSPQLREIQNILRQPPSERTALANTYIAISGPLYGNDPGQTDAVREPDPFMRRMQAIHGQTAGARTSLDNVPINTEPQQPPLNAQRARQESQQEPQREQQRTFTENLNAERVQQGQQPQNGNSR